MAVRASAVSWLAQQTSIPEGTIDNVVRRRRRTTELRTADALLAAIGKPEVFHTGEIVIKQNPMTRQCCDGATLTGSF